MRGAARQSLFGNRLQDVGQVVKVGPVIRLEGPAHDQDFLDVSRRRQVGQRRLHAFADHPNDCLWGLMLPRPLGRQEFEPHRAESVNVTGFGERQVFALCGLHPEGAHDFGG